MSNAMPSTFIPVFLPQPVRKFEVLFSREYPTVTIEATSWGKHDGYDFYFNDEVIAHFPNVLWIREQREGGTS